MVLSQHYHHAIFFKKVGLKQFNIHLIFLMGKGRERKEGKVKIIKGHSNVNN